jgi:mono/diheme cytochrome c family protein
MRIGTTLGFLVLAAWAGFSVARLRAQSGAPATGRERASVVGAALYANYCAVCHGKEGKTPVAPASRQRAKPPDLQSLASRNKGVFPLARMETLLTGTSASPVVHGGIDMPVWGPILSQGGGDPNLGAARAHALARYLESLQR